MTGTFGLPALEDYLAIVRKMSLGSLCSGGGGVGGGKMLLIK